MLVLASTVLTVVIVFLTGVFATNFFGAQLVQIWHDVLHRIPVVNSIYSSVKQISDTLFSSSGQAFRKALLVQWPHQGMWTIAFLTGTPGGDVVNHLPPDCLSVSTELTKSCKATWTRSTPATETVAWPLTTVPLSSNPFTTSTSAIR